MASRLVRRVAETASKASSAFVSVSSSTPSSSLVCSASVRFMASHSGYGHGGHGRNSNSKRERPPSTADSSFSLGIDDAATTSDGGDDRPRQRSAAAGAKRAAIADAKERRQADAKATAEARKAEAAFDKEDGLASSSSDSEPEEEQVPVLVNSKTGTAVPAWLGITGSVADDDSDGDDLTGGRGGRLPPATVDASEMAVDDRLALDPAYRARATRQALYRRRNMRAAFDGDEDALERFSLAFAREHAYESSLELSDIDDITRPDDYKRGAGEDPLERELKHERERRRVGLLDRRKELLVVVFQSALCFSLLLRCLPSLSAGLGGLPFNLNAISFRSTLSLSHPLKQRKRNRRVRLEARVGALGVDESTAAYVRAIAGTHYHRPSDTLVVSSDRSDDQAVNRREVIEQLTNLVLEAKRLRGVHGPFPTVVKLPRYSH